MLFTRVSDRQSTPSFSAPLTTPLKSVNASSKSVNSVSKSNSENNALIISASIDSAPALKITKSSFFSNLGLFAIVFRLEPFACKWDSRASTVYELNFVSRNFMREFATISLNLFSYPIGNYLEIHSCPFAVSDHFPSKPISIQWLCLRNNIHISTNWVSASSDLTMSSLLWPLTKDRDMYAACFNPTSSIAFASKIVIINSIQCKYRKDTPSSCSSLTPKA
jgi:hypothetical protein